MMALPLLEIFRQMPVYFASYNTFKHFLKLINPKLIETPIYNDNYNLASIFYFLKDFRLYYKQLKFKLRLFSGENFAFLKNIYKKLKKDSSKPINNTEIHDAVEQLFESSNLLNEMFDKKITRNSITKESGYYSRIMPVLIYINYLEKMYNGKIHRDIK